VQIMLFASLAKSFGGAEVRFEGENVPTTVGELLERLRAMGNHQFRSELASVNILLNGRNVEFLEGLETRVGPGDTITLIPPVAGG